MENEFLEHKMSKMIKLSKLEYFANKLSFKLFHKGIPNYSLRKYEGNIFLYAAMGFWDLVVNRETLKYLGDNGNKVCIYCFDTWESQYAEWEQLFNYIHPTAIFLAYKQSVTYFAQKFDNVFFLPQSMDKTYFHDYHEHKSRLFMQMGRRNEEIHRMILEYMGTHGIENTDENYIYEKVKGKIIYPDTAELARNINRTKYFVCAPQSLENSALTGSVTDVTARFYEAMASKTLIIGFKPKNVFDELFPYEGAMIDLSIYKLDEVVDYFDKHPEEYQRLVEQNYSFVMKNHTWSNRLRTIMSDLQIALSCDK